MTSEVGSVEGVAAGLLSLGGRVEEALRRAVLVFVHGREELVAPVMEAEAGINLAEVALERSCVHLLTTGAVASAEECRFLLAAIKTVASLERMGDLAVNMAERVAEVRHDGPFEPPRRLRRMAEDVLGMVRRSIDALVRRDVALAWSVCAADDAVDEAHARVLADLVTRMRSHPDEARRHMAVQSVSRYLERVADLATNVAQDVIFAVTGDIVRHQPPPREAQEGPLLRPTAWLRMSAGPSAAADLP